MFPKDWTFFWRCYFYSIIRQPLLNNYSVFMSGRSIERIYSLWPKGYVMKKTAMYLEAFYSWVVHKLGWNSMGCWWPFLNPELEITQKWSGSRWIPATNLKPIKNSWADRLIGLLWDVYVHVCVLGEGRMRKMTGRAKEGCVP